MTFRKVNSFLFCKKYVTMKRIWGVLAIVFWAMCSWGQMNIGGAPFSANSNNLAMLPKIATVQFPKLNMQQIHAEDDLRAQSASLHLISRFHNTFLTPSNAGTWTTLPNGDQVWRLRIQAKEALGIHLLYSNFSLPEGTVMYIYNDDYSDILGGLTSANNKSHGMFSSGVVYGEACTIEYYAPASVLEQPVIEISDIGHVYRDVKDPNAQEKAGPCQVDVACSPENVGWEDQIKGVVRLLVTSPQGSGWCSGSMINNTNYDCKQYCLTALHCGVNSNSSHFNQTIFYFNYQRSSCGSGTPSPAQSITGCTKIASSNDGGGSSGPDYMLLEINNNIPSSYNIYYNGWSAETGASANGVSIHHPAGDEKKISTYANALQNAGWGISGTHWRVFWTGTTNGHGVTEGGSSGSPIFNNEGRIVGQLTGGGSSCNHVPNPIADLYGKMSVNWNSGPLNPGNALSQYLDPANTGQLVIDGTFVPCAPITVDNASAETVLSPTGTSCTDTFTPSFVMWNRGGNLMTSATILYNVDGGSNSTYNWTGSLAQNTNETVTFPPVTVSGGMHTFNVIITNVNGNTDGNPANNTISNVFTTTTPISISLTATNPSCGGSDGSIATAITGGTTPLNYSWNSGATTATLSNQSVGTYTLTVTDANNCLKEETVDLINVGGPSAFAASTDQTCAGDCQGTLSSNATGGTGTLSFSWDNGIGTGANHTGVCAGNYTLTVTDAAGCQSLVNVTIGAGTTPPDASFNVFPGATITEGTAANFLNTTSGGATNYTWDFGDGNTSTSLNGVHTFNTPGTYTVTLTAEKGDCSDNETVVITVLDDGVGIADFSQLVSINTFPNPTRDGVNIALAGNENIAIQLDLLTMEGQLIRSEPLAKGQSAHYLDLTHLAQGVYFVSFSNGSERLVKRISKL